MSNSRKKSLRKNISISLLIMFLFFCLSLICFRAYSVYHNKMDLKNKQYNNLQTLITELDMTVHELDRLNNLYMSSKDDHILSTYETIINTYLGEEERDKHKYILHPGEKIAFRSLLINEIDLYQNDYHKEIVDILNKVDGMIISHQIYQQISISSTGNYESLKSEINDLIIVIGSYHQKTMSHMNHTLTILQSLSYSFIALIIIYGVYFMIRINQLVIKPVMDSYEIMNKISNGQEELRLSYKYNNEVSDLFNGLNKFIDISQNSFNLIEEQYNRLKLYSDIGEINYIEYDYESKMVKIFYSKKFMDKYQIENYMMRYSVREYMTLVHPNDRKKVFKQLEYINQHENKEYKLDFRVKFPNALSYCYLSTMGQIQKENGQYFMGVQVDITYLKEIQTQLQQQEEQYRLIVENTTDLISKMSVDGTILYSSKAFRDLFKDGTHVDDYRDKLQVSNDNWLSKILKPPYSSQELILVDTEEGEKWISWNNDAILNENNEVEYIISVGHDITELKRMNDRLKYDAEHDMLTGLLNRRGLFNALKNLDDVKTLAAFFIDINNFKNINDLYGHELGDKIITLLAQDLIKYEKHGCMIGRLSGDEFLVLVPNFENEKSLNFFKNYLNKFMNKNYRIHHNDIYLSASIGYALYPDDTDDFDKLISYADISMYECKLAQMERCLRFSKEMFDLVNNKVEMANALKIAIDQDEFDVYFQTIVDVNNENIEFIESLVRWNSSKGLIMPNDFIPIAEESGFMQSLDLLIIEKAFKQFSLLKRKDKYKNTKLSINVSPILLLRNYFPKRIDNLAEKYELHNNEICVEISENTFVNNIEQSRHQIKVLRGLGFLVALDDFGREYSSLSILDKVDFDIIKIDRLFINDLNVKLNIEIINMIIKIANLTNNLVIVEGVETLEQRSILQDLGCFLMQGYLFSRPKKYFLEDVLVKEVIS